MRPGLAGDAHLVVGVADTADVWGSGDTPVLATPRLVALLEQAAVCALQGSLEIGQTTVGTRIDIEHLAPSRVGAAVTATARLVEVDGRQLEFEVWARDETADVAVARGLHRRAVVDRERFLARVLHR
jgi:predicted thioesterase